jgi:DNA-3-methyladenine glycosylase
LSEKPRLSGSSRLSRPSREPKQPLLTNHAASMIAHRLPRQWYERDALALARALIGCRLVDERDRGGPLRVARIVETEAYRGPKDQASHSRVGITARTRVMFGEAGHAYVFFIYGMHDCFNITCFGPGKAHAVLVRAGEPIAGFDPDARLDGPGRFARAFGITRADTGVDLTQGRLYLCPREKRPRIVASARVGVAYAEEWADRPWRFYDAGSRHVSRPPKTAIGRGSGRTP